MKPGKEQIMRLAWMSELHLQNSVLLASDDDRSELKGEAPDLPLNLLSRFQL